MIKSYLKIAFRNLTQHKSFSLINIIGLAVGIACFITLSLFIIDEQSYDTFNKKADRTYRLYVNYIINGQESCNSKSAAPAGATLLQEFPEVETYTRIGYFGHHMFRYQDKVFREWNIYTADSTFFDVFTLPLIYGNPKTALVKPNSIVLTEASSKKYFGDENPVGKIFDVDGGQSIYIITGVMEDFPEKSHFSCAYLVSNSTYPITESQYWLDLHYTTYLVLREGTDPQSIEKKMETIVINHVGPQAEAILGVPIKAFFEQGNKYGLYLQPLKSIYLHSKRKYGIDPNTEWSQVKNSDIAYSWLFGAIGLFILLIAVFNFMNLATARSERRAKEVGIRKTLGTNQFSLIGQFLIESIIMSGFAVLLALILLEFILPVFNNLANRHLKMEYFSNPYTIPVLIIFTIIVGALAGSYPAFFLSSFRPGQILKASTGRGASKSSIRSLLVIVQFAISITLIIGTLIIKHQLHYIQNKNLGFNKEHLVSITNARILGSRTDVFEHELKKNPNVVSVTNSSQMFRAGIPGNGFLYNRKAGTDPVFFQLLDVDYNFLETFQIDLKAGRFFSREFSSDTLAVVLNQAALRECGDEHGDPIGKILTQIGMGNDHKTYKIIGVINDFNYESLHQEIRPLVLLLRLPRQAASILTIRVLADDLPKTINSILDTWNRIADGERCNYSFVDQNLAHMYEAEQKIGNITTVFSFLAIFVACLGLFGLTAFVIEQRIKEIGIRKILGASILSIITLLSKEFTKWVLLANLIAWPIAWFVMDRWLQDFAYRVAPSWWTFALAGILALAVALATISWQAIRAASANPVDALKYE